MRLADKFQGRLLPMATYSEMKFLIQPANIVCHMKLQDGKLQRPIGQTFV